MSSRPSLLLKVYCERFAHSFSRQINRGGESLRRIEVKPIGPQDHAATLDSEIRIIKTRVSSLL